MEAVHDEAKAMQRWIDEQQRLWDSGLLEAVRNQAEGKESGQGRVQASAVDISRVSTEGIIAASNAESLNLDILDPRNLSRYTSQVTAAIDGEMPANRMVLIGKPPAIIQKYMQSEKALYIPQASIKKAVFDKSVKGGKHGLGRIVIDDLPYQFSAPLAITGNTSQHESLNDNSIVVWTDWMTEDGHSIIVPIRIDANGYVGVYNNVNTVFDAYNETYVEDLLREGNILYTDNNRSIQDLLASQRRQVPKVQEEPDASGKKIPQGDQDVKAQERDVTRTPGP